MELFAGAQVDKVFVEAKGEDELFFLVVMQKEGHFIKALLNASNGRLTRYVQRGVSDAALPGVAIIPEQARQIALGQAGGGIITDFEFGKTSRGFMYQVEVHREGTRYRILLSAVDGSVTGLSTKASALMDVWDPVAAQPPKVTISDWDDGWFDDDDDDWYQDDS